MKTKSRDLPWMFPVPFKTSSFIPLYKKHACFNIETDLSQMKAFKYSTKNNPKHIIHADLQSIDTGNIGRRLGSGRSAFYKGKYLKGMGVTPLTGSWSARSDLYHTSGLMFSTAALREFLITKLIASHNLSHLIVPTTGLLLKPYPKNVKSHVSEVFKKMLADIQPKPNFPPFLTRFQAISVKDGHFARFSNFVWWLQNFPTFSHPLNHTYFGQFMELFVEAFTPFNNKDQKKPIYPDTIASAFSKSMTKNITQYLEFWKHGISWGSLTNNFTMDGRFLDTELPTIMPHAIFGILANSFLNKDYGIKLWHSPGDCFRMSGFEVLRYVQQYQTFCMFLTQSLDFLSKINVFSDQEKVFAKDFCHYLKKEISKNHVLSSKRALKTIVLDAMTKRLNLSAPETKDVSDCLELAMSYLHYPKSQLSAKRKVKLKMVPIKIDRVADSEPASANDLVLVPEWMAHRIKIKNPIPENMTANDLIKKTEATKSIDDAFSILRSSNKHLKKPTLD